MTAVMEFVPLIAASPLLLYAGIEDVRRLHISNRLVLCLMGVFVLTAPALEMPEAGMRLLAAGTVFVVCFLLFCRRVLAGGDVKMMSAALLFVPSLSLSNYGWSFSISMIAAVAAVSALRRTCLFPGQARWAAVAQPGKLPMGLAISLSLAMLPAVELLTS